MKKIYILDAVAFLFRSYYAIKGMTNSQGQSTNALYGFIRSVQKLIKDFAPENLIAIFDGPNNKARRVALYQEYKSNRTGMPEDLAYQLEWAHDFCLNAGIPYLAEPGVEADDLIGAIAKWAEKKGMEVFICSSDKDLCQLVTDRVSMLNTHKNNLLITPEKVEEIHGVKPDQIVDYLAIMGDSSDNIPGIPGFGPKTAATLLKAHGSLDAILNNLDQLSNQKWAEKIRAHKEEAKISQKLASLFDDVPFPEDLHFYQIKPPQLPALQKLYETMNFNTLLSELELPLPQQEEELVSYTILDSEEEVLELINHLMQEQEICIDTETDQLFPMAAKLVGIGLCTSPARAWYLPTNGALGLERILELIKPLLENPSIAFYGHNIKYDLHIFKNHGIEIRSIGFDTMIASYLCNPQKNRHSLDALSLEKFGKTKTAITSLIGSGKQEISMREVPIEKVGHYCCEDVDYTCRLKALFEKEILSEGLSKVLQEIELPLIPVLVAMERRGIFIDEEKLNSMSGILRDELSRLENEIHTLAGEAFNIKSPKQLGEILFDKLGIRTGGKKKSTRAEILEELKSEHPIAEKILEYRALEKLRSTYVEALPHQIYAKTGRIHCSFMQTVAATGRLSCQDPNLQNIPIRTEEGRKIREAFLPEKEGWSFLSADYSQIELRLLAHLSQDPKLLSAFQGCEDIHKATAATVFDLPLYQVTHKMRAAAKAVNFGIIYGQQAYGLSKELGIPLKEASLFIQKYFNLYQGVRDFIEASKESVRKSGEATTMFGRKRPIPDILSKNGLLRAAAERLAVNTPLQGSQADIIKMAMLKLHQELEKSQLAHMILQVHDELIFEVRDENVSTLSQLVQTLMESITTLSVPLVVNISVGKNWGEC